jgi:hypothetical protein
MSGRTDANLRRRCDGNHKGMLGAKDDAESGKQYGPEGTKGPNVINPSKPYETDPSSIDMLWETSEKMLPV